MFEKHLHCLFFYRAKIGGPMILRDTGGCEVAVEKIEQYLTPDKMFVLFYGLQI